MVKIIKRDRIFSIRLDTDTLQRLDEIARLERNDRINIIRIAIDEKLDDIEEGIEKETLKGYISGMDTEEQLLKTMDWKKVPADIQQARQDFLQNLVKELKEDKE